MAATALSDGACVCSTTTSISTSTTMSTTSETSTSSSTSTTSTSASSTSASSTSTASTSTTVTTSTTATSTVPPSTTVTVPASTTVTPTTIQPTVAPTITSAIATTTTPASESSVAWIAAVVLGVIVLVGLLTFIAIAVWRERVRRAEYGGDLFVHFPPRSLIAGAPLVGRNPTLDFKKRVWIASGTCRTSISTTRPTTFWVRSAFASVAARAPLLTSCSLSE